MDHKVGPRQCKSVDWLLDSYRNHFGLQFGKNGRGIMKVEVPKIQFSWSNGFCGERGKRGGLVEKLGFHGREMLL